MSDETSITHALKVLNPLNLALEDAFWDTCELQVKDRIFDLVISVHAELNELAKLSVSDLDMPYEPITREFAESCIKLSILMDNVDNWFPRTSTAAKLKQSLPEAAGLLKECMLY